MKDEEILDQFGRMVIREAYDNHIALAESDLQDLKQTERFKTLFGSMCPEGKKELEHLIAEISSGMLFDFLKIFMEHQQFKIVHEADGKQVNLVEISESLMAEPVIEGGWIEWFSRFG